MLSDEEMHRRMEKGWRGGKADGTLCGNGSTMKNTENIRAWLPGVCDRYDILSVCDAGAGDMHWIRHVDWDVDYWPFDLFPRNPGVTKKDITREPLPRCDAILCRMVLNHLGDARTEMALKLFRQSARYLIATQFDRGENRTREFLRLDLRKWLGEPLESVQDGHEANCTLAIWAL